MIGENMKCSQIHILLSNYLDGSVTKQERNFIEQHLKTCAECRRELETLQKLSTTLDLMGNVRVSTGFEHQVLDQVRKKEVSRKAWLLPKKWAFIGAGIAAMLLTVYAGHHMGRTFHNKYAKPRPEKTPPIITVYQYGLYCELPDSSFFVQYVNIKM
jgi:predicted anti-sigma-YlaC factor YlaD